LLRDLPGIGSPLTTTRQPMDRYSDTESLTGPLQRQLRGFMISTFTIATLERFACDNFGSDMHSSMSWSPAVAIADACSAVMGYCKSRGLVGKLLEQLKKASGGNAELDGFIERLVEAGYLKDNEAAPPEAANPTGRDWLNEYGIDRLKFSETDLLAVVGFIAQCFDSNAKLERFITANIYNDYAKQLRHNIGGNASVASNVSRVVGDLARVGWLNAFVMAVLRGHKTHTRANAPSLPSARADH